MFQFEKGYSFHPKTIASHLKLRKSTLYQMATLDSANGILEIHSTQLSINPFSRPSLRAGYLLKRDSSTEVQN